ncbi:DUF58 domain-containing protein [Propionibacteriaceae bacterium Y1685]
MRKAWSALTARGKTLTLVGLALTVLTALAGERDVLVIGLVLLLLPVLTILFLSRSRLRITCERSITPGETTIGSELTGQLSIVQRGRLPMGLVMLEDEVPAELGERPRFLIEEAGRDWRRTLRYPLKARVRGRYHTGPLRVRLSDPLGLVDLERHFNATSDVLITPKVYDLEQLRLAGGGGQSGDNRPHRIGVVGQDDVLVREYRRGDDVRRIHWRSTARRGDLMVRREEQAWDPSAAIIIDNRVTAHAGNTMTGSFEWAVSAAASIGQHFLDDGFNIEMYHAEGSLNLSRVSGQRESVKHIMIRDLAEITTKPTSTLKEGLEIAVADSMGQVVVAIAGRLTAAEAYALARARRNRALGMIFLLDVDSFGSGRGGRRVAPPEEVVREREHVREILIGEQWRVIEVRNDKSVQAAWEELGAMGVSV